MKAIIEFHWYFIPAGFGSTISLFADDTIAYLVIKSNSDALSLKRDLDKLAQWEQLWKMAIYPEKQTTICFNSLQQIQVKEFFFFN
jgi:hypothetical protein